MGPLRHAADAAPPTFDPSQPRAAFSAQWSHPKDVFSVLLILGGDTVLRALGQIGGSRLTPVAFSFGWVAYAVAALAASFGENKLMPDPDCAALVVNAHSGYARANTSWVLGRVVRDFEFWSRRAPAIQTKVRHMIEQRHREVAGDGAGAAAQRPKQAGLCVSVFEAGDAARAGVAGKDWVYKSGFLVMVLQLCIAAVPLGVFGDWGILLITAAGTALSLATGALSQWATEKWACRRNASKTVVLTRGNGAQHAIVVLGRGRGLDLEDLAAVAANAHVVATTPTRLWLMLLAVLWVLLLITAAGTQQNTWFLLAIGGLGILHNTAAAGWRRNPEDLGVPLDFVEVLGSSRVMQTLLDVERKYPRLGASLRPIFFPGALREHEIQEWNALRVEAEALDARVAAAPKEQMLVSATKGSAEAPTEMQTAQGAANNAL